MSTTTTSSNGVPMTTYTTFQATLTIHPDHVGFVIGSKGATVRRVGMLHTVDVRLKTKTGPQNHELSVTWPYIQIRGQMEKVESAYFDMQQIANVANQRIPRLPTQVTLTSHTDHIQQHTHNSTPTPPPLNVTIGGNDSDDGDIQSPDYTPISPTIPPTPENWSGPHYNKYLKGTTEPKKHFANWEDAVEAAINNLECTGITTTDKGRYSLRIGRDLQDVPEHKTELIISWMKL